jgi:hypothetical protein
MLPPLLDRRPFAACALLTLVLYGAPASAQLSVGVQSVFFVGKHFETDNDVNGSAAGAFFEATVRGRRLGLHLEGVPNIDAHATSAGDFGKLTESISVLTADARVYVGRNGRSYVSVGEAVFTQSTPLLLAPPFGNVFTDSRVVGLRFGAGTRVNLRSAFIEASLVGAPALHGRISYRTSPLIHPPEQTERATEVDAIAALGRRYRRFEVLAGLRNINYAADLARGGSADRNVGTGLFLEGRYLIGR